MSKGDNLIPYQFKKGQSGNPNGRPKSRVNETLLKVMPRRRVNKFYGMTVQELQQWEEALLTMQLDELTALAQENSAPIYVRGLAMTILTEARDGKSVALAKLREHVFGKALQRMELTGADGSSLVPAPRILSKEEFSEFWQKLDKDF